MRWGLVSKPGRPRRATLHAEALMNLQPWDYWDEEGPAEGQHAEIVARLESDHRAQSGAPGRLHLYIHAVEASPSRSAASQRRTGCATSSRRPDTSSTCRRTSMHGWGAGTTP
jgi:hypothetical protein